MSFPGNCQGHPGKIIVFPDFPKRSHSPSPTGSVGSGGAVSSGGSSPSGVSPGSCGAVSSGAAVSSGPGVSSGAGDSSGAVEYELGKIGEKYEVETPEGKILALKEAVNLLSEMRNPLEREVWAGKLANDYGTTKEGILSQVQAKIRRRIRNNEQKAIQTSPLSIGGSAAIPEKAKNPAAAAAEERLLGSVFRNPEVLRKLPDKISEGDFVCELYRRFYAKAASGYAMGYDLSPSLFNEDFSLEEQNIIGKIFHLSREHQYTAEDAFDAAETMLKLKSKKTDSEIAELSGAELTDYIEKMRREKQKASK